MDTGNKTAGTGLWYSFEVTCRSDQIPSALRSLTAD